VLKVLGRGGMGVVFLGEDVRLGRSIALKVMLPEMAQRPEARERFLREAKAAAAIEHDHIVAIYQVDEDHGIPYIAMPLLKGMSMEDWLRRKEQGQDPEPIRVGQILKLGREIARGLAAAHARGLIHRDIKPANIWLDASAGGRAKILDFGLARPTSGDQALTQTGMILGTPAYMAPEQARSGKVDARADLFSLGVILYRLATGVQPFQTGDMMSTLMALATKHPDPPLQLNPELPPALSDLIMKLLEKDPAHRMASGSEVAKAIHGIEVSLAALDRTEVTPAAPPPPRKPTARAPAIEPPKTSPPKARGSLVAVIAAIVVLLGGLAVAGLVVFWPMIAGPTHSEPAATGTVRLEITDPDVRVTLDGQGAAIHGTEDTHTVPVAPGEHRLSVERRGLRFETDSFALHAGETVTLKVEVGGGKVRVAHGNHVIAEKALAVPATTKPPVSGPQWVSIFNGHNLDSWDVVGNGAWSASDGILKADGGVGWLATKRDYSDFELELDYRLPRDGNSGIFLRAFKNGALSGVDFLEVQLLDDRNHVRLKPMHATGALYNLVAPYPILRPAIEQWHKVHVRASGEHIMVAINGIEVVNAKVPRKEKSGRIGLQMSRPGAEFRNIRVRDQSGRPRVFD
jgi:hypothetical protein